MCNHYKRYRVRVSPPFVQTDYYLVTVEVRDPSVFTTGPVYIEDRDLESLCKPGE